MSHLLFLDILDEDIKKFRDAGVSYVIEESSLGPKVVLIPQKEDASMFPDAICYLPEEIPYLLSLTDEEAKNLNVLKRVKGFVCVGGSHAT